MSPSHLCFLMFPKMSTQDNFVPTSPSPTPTPLFINLRSFLHKSFYMSYCFTTLHLFLAVVTCFSRVSIINFSKMCTYTRLSPPSPPLIQKRNILLTMILLDVSTLFSKFSCCSLSFFLRALRSSELIEI